MELWYFYSDNSTACKAIADRIPPEAKQIDCLTITGDNYCHVYKVVTVPLFMIVNEKQEEVARLETVDTTKIMAWYKGVCDDRDTQDNT